MPLPRTIGTTWPSLKNTECIGLLKQTSLAPNDHLNDFLSGLKNEESGRVAPKYSPIKCTDI